MSEKLKVAVLGASGIGRNHARWLHGHGADVVAFLGSSDASVARTEAALKAQFPFQGRGYTDLTELLRQERPNAVVVSTPPHLHFWQVDECLKSGAHVLCEKPLVYDETKLSGELRHEASELITLANQKQRIFAVQTQYVMLAPDLLELCGLGEEEVRNFSMEMETRNPNAGSGRDLWLDLSPHPLSVLLALCGANAQLQPGATLHLSDSEARADFVLRRANGTLLNARIRVAFKSDGPLLRRFALNGRAIDVSGRPNENGDYRIYLRDSNREIERCDLVDDLIGAWLNALRGENTLPVALSGASGARNLDLCLALLEAEN